MTTYSFQRYKDEGGTWRWAAYCSTWDGRSGASRREADGFRRLADAREWAKARAKWKGIEYREPERPKKPPPPTLHEAYLSKQRQKVGHVHLSDRLSAEAQGRGENLREAEFLLSSVRHIVQLMELQPGKHRRNSKAAVSRLDLAIDALEREKKRILSRADDRPGHLRAVD